MQFEASLLTQPGRLYRAHVLVLRFLLIFPYLASAHCSYVEAICLPCVEILIIVSVFYGRQASSTASLNSTYFTTTFPNNVLRMIFLDYLDH